jgi:glycyl-tRNA synthetase
MNIYADAEQGDDPIQEVNLMMSTQTSVKDDLSYLRPETAQKTFTEFKSTSSHCKSCLPVGIATIGRVFRKEISPIPFTRLREFNQAELEYFYDPTTLTDPKNCNYNFLLSHPLQVVTREDPHHSKSLTLSQLATENYICHEWMYRFIVQAIHFCLRIGIDLGRLRLRQHHSNELAHYSSDCWDIDFNAAFADGETRWLEIIGISDRGTFDLSAHEQRCGQSLKATRPFGKYPLTISTGAVPTRPMPMFVLRTSLRSMPRKYFGRPSNLPFDYRKYYIL